MKISSNSQSQQKLITIRIPGRNRRKEPKSPNGTWIGPPKMVKIPHQVAVLTIFQEDVSGGHPMSDSSSLDCSVLVLNRFYMAIRVVDVRRAMTLLYRSCAEVITIEDDQYINYDFENWSELSDLHCMEKQPGEDYIKTPTRELQVPRIIRLVLYDRVPKSTVRFNRKTLFARDSHRCQYCGQARAMSQLSLDHVVPRSQGGKTTWENVVCSCVGCNSKKGGRTPVQAGMKLLSDPVRPSANPGISVTLKDPRYSSWKTFLPSAGTVN
jgi:5-methylcytosine-specific restriction endonuclease McrA